MVVWDRAAEAEAAAGRRRDGGGTEAGRDTESKTRTPHKDAGKKTLWCFGRIFCILQAFSDHGASQIDASEAA